MFSLYPRGVYILVPSNTLKKKKVAGKEKILLRLDDFLQVSYKMVSTLCDKRSCLYLQVCSVCVLHPSQLWQSASTVFLALCNILLLVSPKALTVFHTTRTTVFVKDLGIINK